GDHRAVRPRAPEAGVQVVAAGFRREARAPVRGHAVAELAHLPAELALRGQLLAELEVGGLRAHPPGTARWTTDSPHASPEAKSSSGSTSPSQPMKCFEASSAVEP